MIGVDLQEKDVDVCNEFFELFKTPWEIYRKDSVYDAVISTNKATISIASGLWFIYNSEETLFDVQNKLRVVLEKDDKQLIVQETVIPLYGNCSRLIKNDKDFGTRLEIGETGHGVLRFGYDLFGEIRFLLEKGQPPQNSLIPTLDMHIMVIRNAIIDSGATLVEIPPIPAGYSCMACLTHDVDFIGIRQHFFDYTMFGFLYRALFGSVKKLLNKRISLSALLVNWKAVLSLPFVYFGIVKDIWDDLDEYLELEKGLGGTYFFMPFKNRPGKRVAVPQAHKRATKYSLAEARKIMVKLLGNSCEIGVHGIDAWHDEVLAVEERKQVVAYTDTTTAGIRIHWLLFDDTSFTVLDKAGYAYDSTFGYNDAVGFRAGTTQAFRPVGCKHLIELPMHIQDVALFNEGRLHYSEKQAFAVCSSIYKNFLLYGGALTLLWHTRSLAPERLQGPFYASLLEHVKKSNAWFATADKIVSWFVKRREIRFEDNAVLDKYATINSSAIGTEVPGCFFRSIKKDPRTGVVTITDRPF